MSEKVNFTGMICHINDNLIESEVIRQYIRTDRKTDIEGNKVHIYNINCDNRYIKMVISDGKAKPWNPNVVNIDIKGSIPSDLNVDADYMENCFVTDDGLKVGYYISEGSAEWYVILTGLNSDTLFFKNLKSLISVFVGAKERIESIKTANHKIA